MKINIKPAKIGINLDAQKVYPELEDLEITPHKVEQNFKSNKYGYDNIKVKAIESETLNITPTKEDQTYTGMFDTVNVEKIESEALNITPTEEIQNYEGMFDTVNVDKINTEEKIEKLDFSNTDNIEVKPSENKYLKKVTINKDENLIPSNIAEGTKIFGIEGSLPANNFEINDASYLFYGHARLNIFDDLLKLCKNVNKSHYMFMNCGDLTELDLSSFNTENVSNMDHMFNSCSNLTELDVSSFNTENVSNMEYMFSNCGKLTELDLSSFNTKNVSSMRNMFSSCEKLVSLDLSNADMSSVYNITNTFLYNFALKNLKFGINLGKSYTNITNYTTQKINLNKSTNLTYESLMFLINNIYDLNLTYNVANGGTLYTQTLALGSTNTAKLTAEEIAIATNKGWTVS